jgi:hypothetical protein
LLIREDRKMEGNMFKKSLVVGIIFLFIGVGVQPVFAKNTIKTTISETLEDCECQPIRKEIDYYNLRSQGEIIHTLYVVYIRGEADFEVDENGRWKRGEGWVYWADPIDLIITGIFCWSPNPWQPYPDWYYYNKIDVLSDVDLKLLILHYFGYAENNRLSGIGFFGVVGYYD